jgi:magnesium-transporting ATPase (P-type)
VRPEVPDAIRRCRRAGVEVAMITGDHPATAFAIARELGLAAGADAVVTGGALAQVESDPAAFAALVARARVFARVEPGQKTAIVNALAAAGHFVAVTGDGVNDAPALHAANIGVAMGKGGTDIARGAADLIVTDDNFASIVNGIEEGRVAYDNVRKVTYLLVSTGVAEIILFALSIGFGLPIPLFAVQLLWLNLVTNGIQDVALAFERGEAGVLDRAPRPPRQRIFDRRMIEQTMLSGAFMGTAAFAFFAACLAVGWPEERARNAVLLLMVLFENMHIFNCRSETRSVLRVPLAANPFVVIAAIATQAIHVAAMYLPGISDVLRIGPVLPETYGAVAAIALVLVLVMEGYKRLRYRTT